MNGIVPSDKPKTARSYRAGVIDDNWHHVCIIVKAGTSIEIYVDKVLERSNYVASGALIDMTNWYNYCFTYSAGTVVFYINGTVVGHTVTAGAIPTTLYTGGENLNFINIGTIDNCNDYFWDGLIDEVFFYDKALSAPEVSKNYKHGKGKHKN